MAKFECTLQGDYDQALRYFHDGILNGSMSASFEEESYFQTFGVRVTVRVYKRYSMTGGNRLSMTLTLVGDGEKLLLSGITAGGSQGILFKFNTFGEAGRPGPPSTESGGPWENGAPGSSRPTCVGGRDASRSVRKTTKRPQDKEKRTHRDASLRDCP